MENKLTGIFKGAAHRVQIECYPKTAEIKILLLPADGREPISITQNLGQPMPPCQAFLAEDMLDPRENGFMALMEQNGLGYIVDYKRYDADVSTGRMRRVAAIFQFNQDALQRLTPEGCARYEHHYAKLVAHIVFTADSFEEDCSLLSRAYAVSSDNKAFRPNMGGYSIYAACLDGRDNGVRLEWYMAEEKGGSAKGKWKVESCYILEYMQDAAAVAHYERTPQGDGTVCYFFGDTMIRVKESDLDGRIQLEPVGGNQIVCGEWGKLDFTLDVVAGYCTLLSRVINSISNGAQPSGHEKEAASGENIDVVMEVKGGIVHCDGKQHQPLGAEILLACLPHLADAGLSALHSQS